jgi:hypothetical protein
MLVEGLFNGHPIRLETGSDRNLVLVSLGSSRHLVDVERRQVYPMTSVAAMIRAGSSTTAPRCCPTAAQWSAGPQVAGHASTYHVLQVGERICGEVLASSWMTPFIEPITRSLELMQRVEPGLRPVDRAECGAIPSRLRPQRLAADGRLGRTRRPSSPRPSASTTTRTTRSSSDRRRRARRTASNMGRMLGRSCMPENRASAAPLPADTALAA